VKRLVLAVPLVLLPWLALAAPADEGAETAFAQVVRPFLDRYCTSCHAPPRPQGGLDLSGLDTLERARERRVPFDLLRGRVARGEMPPRGAAPRPTETARRAFLVAVDRIRSGVSEPTPASPGRVTVRRLNRREYAHTVRDLLGVAVDAERLFPADDVGYGFDNVGDVLSLPPVLLEKYLLAAEGIAAAAVVDLDPGAPPVRRYEGRDLAAQGGARWPGQGAWALTSNGEVGASHPFERDGRYRLRARVFAQQAGKDLARMELRVDGRAVAAVDVEAERGAPADHAVEVEVGAGTHRIGAAFVNDYYMPQAEDPAQRDRNLHVVFVEVEGPLDALPPTAFQRRFLPDPTADGALRTFVEAVAPRAWRRPVGPEEVDRVLAAVDAAHAGDAATRPGARARTALVALLVSPFFVYLAEPAEEGAVALTGHQLAARLSYFLWSSLPDDELREAADAGHLGEPGALEAQADRMLRDARASALAEGFATQWLAIGDLANARPDPERFPGVDAALLDDMRRETVLSFETVLREGRDVRELLDADYVFVNERLADLYGLPGVKGPHLRRVRVTDGRRGGVLRQASVLTATSNPDRTSPVKRGKWILETLLDRAPPPPPANAGTLDESGGTLTAASLREQLARHRADPACAACHDAMDPLGFALEHYDAVGRWRERDGGVEIDASGVLPDGRRLADVDDLVATLRADDGFLRSLAKHLLTYALGRGVDERDEAALATLTRALEEEPTLERLVRAIVGLGAFRLRAAPSGASENAASPEERE